MKSIEESPSPATSPVAADSSNAPAFRMMETLQQGLANSLKDTTQYRIVNFHRPLSDVSQYIDGPDQSSTTRYAMATVIFRLSSKLGFTPHSCYSRRGKNNIKLNGYFAERAIFTLQ